MILSAWGVQHLQEALVDIGKKLKKNNIAVDVVGLAAEEDNIPKLEAFQVRLRALQALLLNHTERSIDKQSDLLRLCTLQEAVNSGDNSHLVVVPAGSVLSDNLYNTPLFQGEGHGFAGAEAGAGGDAEVSHAFAIFRVEALP